MDTFVKRFQPDKYDAWINGTDIAPHPEDPPSAAKPAPLPSDQDILVNKKYKQLTLFALCDIFNDHTFLLFIFAAIQMCQIMFCNRLKSNATHC